MKTSDLNLNAIDHQLLELAFEEDLGSPYNDLTTHLLFPHAGTKKTTAKIISKESKEIILAGQKIANYITNKFSLRLQSVYQDGESVPPGATIFILQGPPSALLMVERTLLNFLQRLCAIATMTHEFVKNIQHTSVKILDTRKTMPGFRHLEKYAVQCGGGANHRFGLYDALMIKDTHIDALGGIQQALARIPDSLHQQYPIIVEVRNLEELQHTLNESHKITRILLDNMSLCLLSKSVHLCQGIIPTEASGNVSLNTVRGIAETGVNFISIGKITHSAGIVDLSMKCDL